ncbi:MAG: DinB family protein [Candidatus Nanopelagicales bacterium]
MTSFSDDDLRGAEFARVKLHGARFRETNLSESTFYDVTFERATFREAYFEGARFVGTVFDGAEIDGSIEGLVVNGVAVEPLIEAELDRQNPGREKLRSDDPDELREAWAWLEGLWATTTAEARTHPESSLNLRVDDEWSFLETLRHLVFASETWLGAGVLGRTTYHHLGLAGPWFDHTLAGLDPEARPSVDEVLAARADQQAMVRDYLETATPETLAMERSAPEGAPWPPPGPMSVLRRLHVILNEEWWHHRFATRDMAHWPTP